MQALSRLHTRHEPLRHKTVDIATLFWHKHGDYAVYKPTGLGHKLRINGAVSHVGSFVPAAGVERLKRIELQAALTGDCAKAAGFEHLEQAVNSSRQRWLQLPLSYAHIGIGDQVSCEKQPDQSFLVCEKTIEAGVLRLHVTQARTSLAPLTSEAGGVPGPTMLARQPVSIALVELAGTMFESGPEVAVLVSGGHDPFQSLPVTMTYGASEQHLLSAPAPSPRGNLLLSLPPAASEFYDQQGVVEVEFEQDPLLVSCDEAALLAGANLLWVDGEFVQFATAVAMGGATYRLSGLIRGRFDTGTQAAHAIGSPVLLMDPDRLTTIKLPLECIGSTLVARVHGPDQESAKASLTIAGLADMPWAPEHVVVSELESGLQLSWIRRCKEGAPWLDGVDAPLGTKPELYSVSLTGGNGKSFDLKTNVPSAHIDTQRLNDLGPRPWHLKVRQLGNFAPGRPYIHIIE